MTHYEKLKRAVKDGKFKTFIKAETLKRNLCNEELDEVQELQNANPSIHVGFISNVNYFTSKNGNPCARYDITLGTGETLEGRITVHPPLMYQGSFIFFEIGDNPIFPNIIQVA